MHCSFKNNTLPNLDFSDAYFIINKSNFVQEDACKNVLVTVLYLFLILFMYQYYGFTVFFVFCFSIQKIVAPELHIGPSQIARKDFISEG